LPALSTQRIYQVNKAPRRAYRMGPGRSDEGRVLDVAKVEQIEGDLNALIERRARGVDPDENADLWRESVRRYRARHREERLRDRLAYHRAMLEAHTRNFEEILRRHRVGIRLVEEALGIAAGPGNGRA
jgi:hypothetical protein